MTTIDEQVPGVDAATTEEFSARMVDILNDACTAIMTSIGYRTGLFEALAQLPPSTSAEVARAAGLNERYVREWLNAMTVARIVVHDDRRRTYRLPQEHAACLTEAAGPDNLARMMQYVCLGAAVEDPIITCFRRGGGLSYSDYPRFHEVMAEDSAAVFDVALVDVIVPLVPGAVDRLRTGIDVADIGCGRGHAVNLLAQAFPASRFTGYDFSSEAIDSARSEAASWGLANARFEVQDVAELPTVAEHDLVTAFDAIHDQAHPGQVLSRIQRTLRPGGVFLMVDTKCSSNVNENLDHVVGPFLYTASTLHCMSVSLGLDGDGLGTAWGEQLAVAMLHEAGFRTVEVKEVAEDFFNNYYVATK